MYSFFEKLIYFIGFIVVLFLLIYWALLGASTVYISGGAAESIFIGNPIWDEIDKLNLAGVQPTALKVERLGIIHGLRNGVFLICSAFIIACLPLACALLGIVAMPVGLISANWSVFLTGILSLILLAPLAVFVSILCLFMFWIGLIIQPITPAYFLIWLLIGTPFSILSALGGSVGHYYVIVILIER